MAAAPAASAIAARKITLHAVALLLGVSPFSTPKATIPIPTIGTPVASAHARTVRASTPGVTG